MYLLENTLYIAEGIYLTLGLTLSALLLGICLGIVLAIGRHKHFLYFPIVLFISIMRGTPLILQLSFFYFVLPQILGKPISIFFAGFLSLGLNSSAYIAEILRSGIESLPKGQFEVSKALSIPEYYMWKDIILPQVFKNVFPTLVSEAITIVKETALISVLGGLDIMRRSQLIAAREFTYFIPLVIAGLCYYILVIGIEFLGTYYEKRWNA
ncbi:MAG: amino acid ABC transporter permease [Desulfovibrionaceae bacterium]